MKRILLIPTLAIALALGGCGSGSNVGNFLVAATSTVTNPISSVDIYRVKNTYAATLSLAVDYRNFCYARPYAVLMADPIAAPVCKYRRRVILAIQSARVKAAAAIRAADNFVHNNPTINATSAIAAAWQAVSDFQAAVPAVK